MTTSTIVGAVLGSHRQLAVVDHHGRRTFEAVELADVQPTYLPLVVDHGHDEVGEVLGLEERSDGSVMAVAVVDDIRPELLDGLALSGWWFGDLHDGVLYDSELRHVALVEHGAALAGPITVLPGFDARQHGSGLAMGTPDHVRGLVERAHADHERHRFEVRSRRQRVHRPPVELRSLTVGDTTFVGDRPVGPLTHHGGGRVLAVR